MKKQITTTVMVMSIALVITGCSGNENKTVVQETTTIQQELSSEEETTIEEVKSKKEEDTTLVAEVPATEEPTTEEPTTQAPTVPLTIAEANGITPTDTTKYTKSSLNVRADASVGAELLGRLEMNDKVHVTGDVSNGWKRIEFNGSVGYVSGDYLSDTVTVIDDVPPETTKVPVQEEKPTQQIVEQESTTKASGGSSFSGEFHVRTEEEIENEIEKDRQWMIDNGIMDEEGNIIVPDYNISSGNSSGSNNNDGSITIPDFPGFE